MQDTELYNKSMYIERFYPVITMVKLSYKIWIWRVFHEVKLGLVTVVGDLGSSWSQQFHKPKNNDLLLRHRHTEYMSWNSMCAVNVKDNQKRQGWDSLIQKVFPQKRNNWVGKYSAWCGWLTTERSRVPISGKAETFLAPQTSLALNTPSIWGFALSLTPLT